MHSRYPHGSFLFWKGDNSDHSWLHAHAAGQVTDTTARSFSVLACPSVYDNVTSINPQSNAKTLPCRGDSSVSASSREPSSSRESRWLSHSCDLTCPKPTRPHHDRCNSQSNATVDIMMLSRFMNHVSKPFTPSHARTCSLSVR